MKSCTVHEVTNMTEDVLQPALAGLVSTGIFAVT